MDNPDTAEIYSDFGFSKNTFNRPALSKLMDDVRDGKIKQVITFTPDHLTRSIADYIELENFFIEHEVYYDFVRKEKHHRNDATQANMSSKKHLHYNSNNNRYGIRRGSDWINPGLRCDDPIVININGTWVHTRIALTGDGWYLKGTGFRGSDLDDIEVR